MQDGGKPIEICATFNGNWAWKTPYKNKGVDYIMNSMRACNYLNANLLMNIAPLPDGTIHDEDQKAVREVGNWLKVNGWPKEKIHPKEVWHRWTKRNIEAYPGNGPYRPLKLIY